MAPAARFLSMACRLPFWVGPPSAKNLSGTEDSAERQQIASDALDNQVRIGVVRLSSCGI